MRASQLAARDTTQKRITIMFTIDQDNNIAAHPALPEGADATQAFASQKELAKLTAEWPAARLLDVWNSFAGIAPFDDLKPVKKFTDRKVAIARIWTAVQRLADDTAPPVAPVAPKSKKATKDATAAKKAGTAKQAVEKTSEAREGSKKADVLDLLRRKQGATLAEIMQATGWQAHTVRGFIAGTVTKRLGLKVESFRNDDKVRTYRVG
jgi:hypothetical protein